MNIDFHCNKIYYHWDFVRIKYKLQIIVSIYPNPQSSDFRKSRSKKLGETRKSVHLNKDI